MDYLRFTNFLKDDFKDGNRKYHSVNFFRNRNLIYLMLWLNTLNSYYLKKDYSIEDFINDVPKELGSRPTIFKCVDLAIQHEYLVKNFSTIDKRKYNLKPSKLTIDEFQLWALGFSGF